MVKYPQILLLRSKYWKTDKIFYWMKKLSNYSNKKAFVSKDDEIRKLKTTNLKDIKYFQQDVIKEF
jgi:hypothetical protein